MQTPYISYIELVKSVCNRAIKIKNQEYQESRIKRTYTWCMRYWEILRAIHVMYRCLRIARKIRFSGQRHTQYKIMSTTAPTRIPDPSQSQKTQKSSASTYICGCTYILSLSLLLSLRRRFSKRRRRQIAERITN
jgi:hypothetical protein